MSHYCSGKNGLNTSEEFCDWLLENYFIAFVPGEVFGTPGFMRLSYACVYTNVCVVGIFYLHS